MRFMASSILMFLDHTQRRCTVSSTPLDERSVGRRDLYVTTYNIQTQNIHVPGEIRTHNLSRQAATDLYLWLRGLWERNVCGLRQSRSRTADHADIHLFALDNVRARSLKSQVVLHRTDEAGYLLGSHTNTFDVVLSQHSAFPEGNNGLDAQLIFRPVWNTKFHYRLRKSPPPVSILSQFIPVHNLIFCSECINLYTGPVN